MGFEEPSFTHLLLGTAVFALATGLFWPRLNADVWGELCVRQGNIDLLKEQIRFFFC